MKALVKKRFLLANCQQILLVETDKKLQILKKIKGNNLLYRNHYHFFRIVEWHRLSPCHSTLQANLLIGIIACVQQNTLTFFQTLLQSLLGLSIVTLFVWISVQHKISHICQDIPQIFSWCSAFFNIRRTNQEYASNTVFSSSVTSVLCSTWK